MNLPVALLHSLFCCYCHLPHARWQSLNTAQYVPDRLSAQVNGEKAGREQVEQACVQLGVQLLDLQRQLKASQTREAAATRELADSMDQVSVQRVLLLGSVACLQVRSAAMRDVPTHLSQHDVGSHSVKRSGALRPSVQQQSQ